jgi:hypothetical protein
MYPKILVENLKGGHLLGDLGIKNIILLLVLGGKMSDWNILYIYKNY